MKMKKYDIDTFLSWTQDAIEKHNMWQRESWEDYEFRDGVHWSQEAKTALIAKGINPLTINRIFPVLNLIYGNYIRNQRDIIAKGRTKYDNELAQAASESIQLVVDQNNGTAIQREAFHDAIVPGFGCVYTGFNADPRRENILLRKVPWYSVRWDPYGDPWFDPDRCRYVFTAEWKDIEDVKMFFPNKASEIDDVSLELAAGTFNTALYTSAEEDIEGYVETYKHLLSPSTWVNSQRKRVRPIEMWYTRIKTSWFAVMRDSRVFDLDEYGIREQLALVREAKEVVQAPIKKMHVATFLGNLLLQDIPSPFPHDNYPFTPFIGYLDRFGFPFGVPRQIKEQNMEVDKRRSMALALLGGRRTIMEEGAVEDPNLAHAEASRLDGCIITRKNKIGAFRIDELASLAEPQVAMMLQSEREIQEIVGANDEALGYTTPAQSGVSLEKKRQFSSTVTLSIMENAFRSQKLLGEKILSLVQKTWTDEKVLRVTDRLSGIEKFIQINRPIMTASGAIEIQNDITQARFDLVVTTKEITDTVRDKNLDLLFSAINKAPVEAIAPLLNVAFELSDIPEKERILNKIREATGMTDDTEDMTADERKQRLEELKLRQETQMRQQDTENMLSREISRRESEAKIAKMQAESEAQLTRAQTEKQKVENDIFFNSQKLMEGLFEE
jgi:hypothetical protein